MKPVILSPRVWRRVRDELHTEYPKSVFMLRSKMRTILGFTVREHRNWVSTIGKPDAETNGYYEDQVHLDFFDSRKKSMFLLKYSDLINREGLDCDN
jgi:hypothetical protein